MTLLFCLAEWHAFAKLRLHIDPTLACMETVTTILGFEMRRFYKVTCAAYSTVKLPKEADARGRRQSQKKATATNTEGSEACPLPPVTPAKKPKRKKKNLNLNVYKVHALGDYVRTIRLLGTTDSYSTQTVGFFFDCFFGVNQLRYYL
jgi:hypothetical protein